MPEIPFGSVLGGVTYSHPPTDIPKYFLADAQNIVPTLNGYATKRGGSSILNSTAYGSSVITTFHEFLSGGTSHKFASKGTTIGKYDNSTKFDNHITGLTTGLYGQWVNYGDYAIYANGTDKPQKSDGTTGNALTSDLSGITGGQCLAEWGERIWVGGYASNVAWLTGSALRAPTDFSTATTSSGFWQGYVGNKKQPISGLFSFFDILLIGKLNQMYQLTGAPETDSNTFRLTPVQTKDGDSLGFTSKNAMTQVGNDLLFLDGFNIKRLSGITQYGDVESVTVIANIREYFKDSSGAGLDKNYLQNSQFFHYKHKEQIWCSIPTGANTRYWFVIDYSNPELRAALKIPQYSVFPMAGLTPISFGGVENGSRVDVYAGCNDGYVRRLDTGTNDTSTAIDSHLTWAFGDGARNVQPTFVTLNIKYNSSCTLQPSYAMGLQDWQGLTTSGNFTNLTSQDLTDSSWRTQGNVSYKKLSDMIENTDRSFAFKLRHNTAGEMFEMRKSMFGYRLKHRYIG